MWYTHAAWLSVKALSTAYIIMSQINNKVHIMEVLGLPHYSHVHLKLLHELLLGCSQYSLSIFACLPVYISVKTCHCRPALTVIIQIQIP